MATLDLDAARRERLKKIKTRHSVKFGGQKFELPPEMPALFFYRAVEGKIVEAIRHLLDDRADEFFALGPSSEDLVGVIDAATNAYVRKGPSQTSNGDTPKKSPVETESID